MKNKKIKICLELDEGLKKLINPALLCLLESGKPSLRSIAVYQAILLLSEKMDKSEDPQTRNIRPKTAPKRETNTPVPDPEDWEEREAVDGEDEHLNHPSQTPTQTTTTTATTNSTPNSTPNNMPTTPATQDTTPETDPMSKILKSIQNMGL